METRHPQDAHARSLDSLLAGLRTDGRLGLTSAEAATRLGQYGANELPKERPPTLLKLFLRQFRSGLTRVLVVAAVVAGLVGEINDAIGIFVAVLIDAVFSLVQERRAESALTRLNDLVVLEATVLRDGLNRRVPAARLVPGDVILVQAGDRVAADARLIEGKELRLNESALTGESLPSDKAVGIVETAVPLAEQSNMLHLGTSVVAGSGRAVVTATGLETAFGRIAGSLIQIKRQETPFEIKISRLGRKLGRLSLVLVGGIAIVGFARGWPPIETFLFAIAMAVAVIPEGLPAVMAVVLAIGVRRMARKKAIIRHVPSVETLGVADVICTDKTGTLTENQMTVRRLYAGGRGFEVTGEGWATRGDFLAEGRRFRPSEIPELDLLLTATVVCAQATLEWHDGRAAINGDATEGALVVAAAKAGIDQRLLVENRRRLDEIGFTSERKYRAVLSEAVSGGTRRLFVVGAPESLASRCISFLASGAARPLTPADAYDQEAAQGEMAARALRVVAVAYKDLPSDQAAITDADVANLTFLGLAGMIDPPRSGVAQAIERCRHAGIRVLMLTGDHQATALAIAREIGLIGLESDNAVFSENDVVGLDDAQFDERLRNAVIFARVSPQTKLRIVRGLQRQGHTVAMTGDGVNDAPALKQADVGVAMGLSGTDVSREVADLVLADDNFVTIVNAVEEGRVVFHNVKQTTAYLFATNIGEVVTVLAALLAGLPLPLLAAQILWLNLVTDGFPDIALATEQPHEGLLARPPRGRDAKFLTRNVLIVTALSSLLMCVGSLSLFLLAFERSNDLNYARSVAFTALALFQLWNVFNFRSSIVSVFRLGFFTNPFVNAAVAVSVLLQVAVLYLPGLQTAFSTAPIRVLDWVVIGALTSSIVLFMELLKLAYRRGWLPRAWL